VREAGSTTPAADPAAPPGIAVRRMAAADLPAAERRRGQAGWNQTRADWPRLLAWAPGGGGVAAQDGRVVGTATTTAYGTRLAWLGMLLVAPGAARAGPTRRRATRGAAPARGRPRLAAHGVRVRAAAALPADVARDRLTTRGAAPAPRGAGGAVATPPPAGSYPYPPPLVRRCRCSGRALVVVLPPAEHRAGDHCAAASGGEQSRLRLRHALPQPLLWPSTVAVRSVHLEGLAQVWLAEDEQMIEALAPHAAEEPLAGGVGARGADGRA
jgi:hypothetical protein